MRRFAVSLLALSSCGTGSIVVGGSGDRDASPGGGGNKPIIQSFAAAPDTLAAGGGQVTLSWQVTGAESLVIDPDVGPVTGSYVQTSVPPAPPVAR